MVIVYRTVFFFFLPLQRCLWRQFAASKVDFYLKGNYNSKPTHSHTCRDILTHTFFRQRNTHTHTHTHSPGYCNRTQRVPFAGCILLSLFLCTSLPHLTFPPVCVVWYQTKDITSEKKGGKKSSSKENKGIKKYQNPVGCEGKTVIELRGKGAERWEVE